MGVSTILALVLVALNFISTSAIPTLEAVGSKLFFSDGRQFFMKGVAYQLTEDDPLVDADQCARDAALMKQLGANAIRVYHVDASANHDKCMSTLADAGIYLFVDLDSFKTYIRLASEASWTQNKSDSYREVMDTFQQYDNTGGFFVGNEVLNVITDSGSAPYVLAAAVDMKAYRDKKGYRKIPVGYSATDTDALPMLQDYFVCRSNETERLEFYALNSYRWCGASANYNTSGYNQLQEAADGYPVPIFFSEVGCNTVPPRDFNDQSAIFGPNMTGTWSGSIIYEWIEEMNNYGLVSYGAKVGDDVQIGSSVIQGFTREGTPTPILPDFTNLQSQWATLSPSGVMSSDYVSAITTRSRTCPTFTSGGWTVDPSSPLPTIGQQDLVGVTPMSSSGTKTQSHSGSASSTTSSALAARVAISPVSMPIVQGSILGLTGSMAVFVAVVMFLL